MCNRAFRRIGLAAAMLTLCSLPAANSNEPALAGEPWVRVEEDWELVVNEPDELVHCPQLTIYLTPDVNRSDMYFQLQLNHAAEASFSGGGFRVSALQNEWSVDEARSQTRALLNVNNDVVRWTSVMAVHNGEVLYAIKDGSCQAWGAFGGPEYLLRMPAEGLQDLSRYTPVQSAEDVDVGFGSNRVRSLILKRVRAYREDGTYVVIDVNLTAS